APYLPPLRRGGQGGLLNSWGSRSSALPLVLLRPTSPPYEGSAVRVFEVVDWELSCSCFCGLQDSVGGRVIAEHPCLHLLVPTTARTRRFPPAIAPDAAQIRLQEFAQLCACRCFAQQTQQTLLLDQPVDRHQLSFQVVEQFLVGDFVGLA